MRGLPAGRLEQKGWEMTPYFNELRSGWRPLAAVVIGLSSGLMIISYVIGIMGPYLIGEFGWSKSELALVGSLALGAVLAFPFVGRLTDVLGVRKTSAVGVIACPLLFLGLTTVADIRTYAILYALQTAVLATTTPPVYCRLIMQHFKRARGLALGIAASGPAVTVAIGGPLLNNFVADHGWRAGYMAMAIFTGVMGVASLLLIPKERDEQVTKAKPSAAKKDYGTIFRTPAFWIIFVAILLCNLPQTVMMSQLNLVLAENGASGKAASLMISAYASGTLLGRLVSGVALDRFPAPLVATVGMALSGLGLLLIASGFDSRPVLFLSVLVFGLSVGAEGDVMAYLVVRNFGIRVYSTVHGMLAATVAIAAVVGAVVVSIMLKIYLVFAPFLFLSGALALIGGAMFLLLPRNPKVDDSFAEDEPGPAATTVSTIAPLTASS
jgi:predicted MFS family arabinose efflux permease